jgi:hypothetical protein
VNPSDFHLVESIEFSDRLQEWLGFIHPLRQSDETWHHRLVVQCECRWTIDPQQLLVQTHVGIIEALKHCARLLDAPERIDWVTTDNRCAIDHCDELIREEICTSMKNTANVARAVVPVRARVRQVKKVEDWFEFLLQCIKTCTHGVDLLKKCVQLVQ